MRTINFKRIFLTVLIVSLVLSALLGIIIILFGNFFDIQGNIILTTISLGLTSILGLADSTIYNNPKYHKFAFVGIIITVFTFIFSLPLIWSTDLETSKLLQFEFTFIVISFAIAHISLLLLIQVKQKLIKYMLVCTIGCILFLAFLLIFLTFEADHSSDDFLIRILGVLAILAVLGSILSPIMNKILKPVSQITR